MAAHPPPPLQSANVSPCTPVKTDAWLSGGAGGVVNVPRSPVAPENILTPCRSEGLRCRVILEGPSAQIKAGPGSTGCLLLPPGAVASAAQATVSALVFKANTVFCFQKQITLCWGNSVSHGYWNQSGSLWFFTLVLE